MKKNDKYYRRPKGGVMFIVILKYVFLALLSSTHDTCR